MWGLFVLGGVPVVTFSKVYHNYVKCPTGITANLTATIVSNFPLRELRWLPPPYYSFKNDAKTTRVGNVTTTVLSIPNIQIKNEGNYTLITANKCGEKLAYLYVDIYTGEDYNFILMLMLEMYFF